MVTFADQYVSGFIGGRVAMAAGPMLFHGARFGGTGGTAYSMAMPLFSLPAAAAAASASLQPLFPPAGTGGAGPWALGSAALPTIPVSGFTGPGSQILDLGPAGRGPPPGQAPSLSGK